MSYGSAQTRRSDAGRGGVPAMSATVAAATSSAAVSLPRMERIACSLRNCTEGEEVAKYYTRCRSGFAPAPGVLHISRLRLVLPCDCLQPEHEQRAARVADVDVVTKGADRAECGGRILGADAERHTSARPAADSGEHGDVLLAVGPQIGHRVADDPGGCLELPQQRSGCRIDRLEPAFHRAVEHDAGRRRQRPAVRLTGRVLHLYALVVHADVVGGDVEQLGDR